jgi:hypothetical protein
MSKTYESMKAKNTAGPLHGATRLHHAGGRAARFSFVGDANETFLLGVPKWYSMWDYLHSALDRRQQALVLRPPRPQRPGSLQRRIAFPQPRQHLHRHIHLRTAHEHVVDRYRLCSTLYGNRQPHVFMQVQCRQWSITRVRVWASRHRHGNLTCAGLAVSSHWARYHCSPAVSR